MLDHQEPETWTEIPYQADAPAQTPSVTVHLSETKKAGSLFGNYAPCRCWRCRGGVALADRPILDRLLAKHLVSLPAAAAAEFLSQWRSHPRHDAVARAQLDAWQRIVLGSREPEPKYPIYAMPEAA
ncbi:hypothetical protein [Achromobacter deleyi]|uniref:hypothetical protein n=1 Tax=Achromobacter deleyi TaxID=1353891 RepID=UPI0014675A70|nr:hypothetical protein [Achromobacter deleyi]CAB3870542.1 hypothetical protein LMG3412_02731 [Achromobacter deleyi]